MMIIVLLMGAGLIVAGAFLGLFLWAVRSGQYDDPVTPGWRIVLDDRKPDASKRTTTHTTPSSDTFTEGNDGSAR